MKPEPRYHLASVTTKDASLIERRNTVKMEGHTDEDIFIAGLEKLEKEIREKV